ncbi:STAS domain-containing protein [Tautonia sp. JC769]|uniref:STAS domain-containing protein n=1 Tax=Tautonia sp. JC769 TaxID=3232135 RepID=UPI00345929CB
MPIDSRVDRGVTIVGNLAGVIHDASLHDAARDLDELLDEGRRRFVFELSGVGPIGPSALGLLMTLTRQIRKRSGEVVFARVGRSTREVLETMQMDAHWDLFRTVPEAIASFGPPEPDDDAEEPSP